MARISLGAGLLTVSAWISIPVFDIAFTLQTFALFLLLDLLGGRRGTAAYLVYLGLGILGLPVFSGFQGGAAAIFGVTGGYIWGLLAGCLLWWAMSPQTQATRIAAAAGGTLLCYGLGSAWFLLVYTGGTLADLSAVLLKCVVPYLLPDACKIGLALSLADRLRPVVKF